MPRDTGKRKASDIPIEQSDTSTTRSGKRYNPYYTGTSIDSGHIPIAKSTASIKAL